MFSLTVLALLVAAVSATHSPLGAVQIVPCPSAGEILEVRIPNCNALPCDMIKGQTYEIQVDFVPSVEHTELEIVLSVFFVGRSEEIRRETVPAAVSPGLAYTLRYPYTVTGQYGLDLQVVRLQLTGNGVTEVCGVATAKIRE